jgi:hypothetical protein
MKPPQFSLRSLFLLTAVVAVGCLVGLRVWRLAFPLPLPEHENMESLGPVDVLVDDHELGEWRSPLQRKHDGGD